MNIKDFDKEIDPKILKRGQEYYSDGAVASLKEYSNGSYEAIVNGSTKYTVKATLSKDGDVTKLFCDCPYDFGDVCKHGVATLLAIRNEPIIEKKRKSKDEEINLKDVLAQQTKEALVDLLYSITERDDVIKQTLLLRFSKPDDELTLSKKIIKDCIRRYKKRGYIEYDKVFPALAGAWEVVKRAESYAKSDHMRTVHLYLLVLREVYAMIQFADDSSGGELNDIINYTTIRMRATISDASHALPKQSRDELFNITIKEKDNKVYDGWLFDLEFLDMLIPLCGDPALYKKLWDEFEKEKSKDVQWQQHIAFQQFNMLVQWGDKDERQQFLLAHIQYHDFRKYAIRMAMEDADYKTALHYAQKGIEQDSKEKHSTYVREWQKAAFDAYEAMGDTDKIRELSEYFVRHDYKGFDYYQTLKYNTPKKEWATLLQDLFAFFSAQQYPSETYTKILIIENEFDRLLALCRCHLSKIAKFAPIFPDEYKQEVAKLYIEFILQEAEIAKERRAYRMVCGYLRNFGKTCGKEHMLQLVLQLKAKYPKRPAFLDELSSL